jgi:hypothetical protein
MYIYKQLELSAARQGFDAVMEPALWPRSAAYSQLYVVWPTPWRLVWPTKMRQWMLKRDQITVRKSELRCLDETFELLPIQIFVRS